MKIEKINSNKIKVMIDDDEAKAWNVNIKSNFSEYASGSGYVLEGDQESGAGYGIFLWTAAKLFVETEPHGDEGFGLFITRIESELELE